jgi:adenine phosphoribosyltransferase
MRNITLNQSYSLFHPANMLEQLELKIKKSIRDIPDFPKKGILFKDITPLFLDASLCAEIISEMIKTIDPSIDLICGIESRGFLFGILLAQKLNKPFVMVRKQGKLPADKVSVNYALEYGEATIEVHKGFILPGQKVLIHDDLLATGGTAMAAAELVKMQQATVSQYSFLVELGFLEGRHLLQQICPNINSLIKY